MLLGASRSLRSAAAELVSVSDDPELVGAGLRRRRGTDGGLLGVCLLGLTGLGCPHRKSELYWAWLVASCVGLPGLCVSS
jgi:hypothetical protein